MRMGMGGIGGEYDQTILHEILKELKKILFKSEII